MALFKSGNVVITIYYCYYNFVVVVGWSHCEFVYAVFVLSRDITTDNWEGSTSKMECCGKKVGGSVPLSTCARNVRR